MSTATMRRGRDERNGDDARLEGSNQYASFTPGEQTADSGQVGAPDTVDEHGRSLEALEAEDARTSAADEVGTEISDGEHEVDYDALGPDGYSSADYVEASVSDNPDEAAADVAESEIRARPEPDTPAWVHGGDLYDAERVNTEGTSSADEVLADDEADESDDDKE